VSFGRLTPSKKALFGVAAAEESAKPPSGVTPPPPAKATPAHAQAVASPTAMAVGYESLRLVPRGAAVRDTYGLSFWRLRG
jgi:hypothetical protein